MLTQTEIRRLQEQINASFQSHFDRINGLEKEIEVLRERVGALEEPKKRPKAASKTS